MFHRAIILPARVPSDQLRLLFSSQSTPQPFQRSSKCISTYSKTHRVRTFDVRLKRYEFHIRKYPIVYLTNWGIEQHKTIHFSQNVHDCSAICLTRRCNPLLSCKNPFETLSIHASSSRQSSISTLTWKDRRQLKVGMRYRKRARESLRAHSPLLAASSRTLYLLLLRVDLVPL